MWVNRRCKFKFKGEGIHTVLETAETALGAPTPEELAEKQKLAKEVKSSDALETPVEEKGTIKLMFYLLFSLLLP